MRSFIAACLVCLAPVALAQQQMPPQTLDDRVALDIGRLSMRANALALQNEMLQRALAEANAKIKDLEAKSAPAAAPSPAQP